MAGDRWSTWFWTAMDTTSGSDVSKAFGFQALELTDDHARLLVTVSSALPHLAGR